MHDSSLSIVVLVFALIFFIVGRELICWYWKINKTVALLERIAESLDGKRNQPKIESENE